MLMKMPTKKCVSTHYHTYYIIRLRICKKELNIHNWHISTNTCHIHISYIYIIYIYQYKGLKNNAFFFRQKTQTHPHLKSWGSPTASTQRPPVPSAVSAGPMTQKTFSSPVTRPEASERGRKFPKGGSTLPRKVTCSIKKGLFQWEPLIFRGHVSFFGE